ncbi:hypothetical protein NPIL_607891, partial [Nephila pilipes]
QVFKQDTQHSKQKKRPALRRRKQMTRTQTKKKTQGTSFIKRLPSRRSLLRGSRGRERRDSRETGETIHNQQGIRQGT